MNSTATFFIETACVAGIAPQGMDLSRRGRQRPARAEVEAEERYVDEILATFSDRWEW